MLLLGLALLTVTLAVYLIWRGIDVRLVLLSAGFLLLSAAGTPWVLFETFQKYLGLEDIIGPICSAMGYAFVLKITGCDRDMVNLLIKPLRRIGWLLIPGGCAIGFLTNMAITSQTASAAAVGPVLIPLLLAAGFAPVVAGATLLTGCSVGGNLFNPGEPDIVAIHGATNMDVGSIIGMTVVPNLLSFAAATLVLTILSRRQPLVVFDDPSISASGGSISDSGDSIFVSGDHSSVAVEERPSVLRAMLPALPIVLLLLLQPGLGLIPPLVEVYPKGLPVSLVMLVCTAVVMIVTRANASLLTKEFFKGMGYAFTHVISLIVVAACFIAGLTAAGVIQAAVDVLVRFPTFARGASSVVTWLLAFISGSGTAPSVSFSQAMLPEVSKVDVTQAVRLGIYGAIGASIGRTMSPVAAIVVFTSTLTEVPIPKLIRLVMWPMLAALLVTILYAVF